MSILIQDTNGGGYELTAEEQETQLAFANAFVEGVDDDLKDITNGFFRIAFRLTEANRNEYYKVLGYATIADLAEDKWGFKKSTTYNLLDIYRLAYDPQRPMQIAAPYEKYSQSQLVAITRLKHDQTTALGIIQISECSVRELEKFVSLWNKKYAKGCGYRPGCKTVAEYLQKYEAEDNKDQRNYPGQLPGQQALEPELFQTSGIPGQVPPSIPLRDSTSEIVECELIEEPKAETLSVPAENQIQLSAQHTKEIVEECMRRDGNKNAIYWKCLAQPSREEFIDFLKSFHKRNHGDSWYCSPYVYREYNLLKGIILKGNNCPNLVISWSVAANTIKELIARKSYLTEDELGLNKDKPAPKVPDWSEEPKEEIFQTSGKIEAQTVTEPAQPKTQRARLAELSTYELANEIVMKIVKIYPLKGESIKFISAVRKGLVDWLDAPEVRE